MTLQERLRPLAPGLTPRQALDQLAGVQMLDVQIPTTDGGVLQLTRYAQPDTAVRLLLQRPARSLPEQPPTKLITPDKMELPPGGSVVKTFGAASLKNRRILRVILKISAQYRKSG